MKKRTHLKQDCAGVAVKRPKLALHEGDLGRTEGVHGPHRQHAGKEDLPAQRLREAVGGQLLHRKEQASDWCSEGRGNAHRGTCREVAASESICEGLEIMLAGRIDEHCQEMYDYGFRISGLPNARLM